jgi:phospholipid methyltransferase
MNHNLAPTISLAMRSLAWTLLLPGLFAGYLPWRYFGLAQVRLSLENPVHLLGLLCIGVGAVLLGTCIWEFARSGRGTLAPVDPPRELVIRGLYRYVRNPMYLSVTIIVLGELLLTQSRPLLEPALRPARPGAPSRTPSSAPLPPGPSGYRAAPTPGSCPCL